MIPEFHLWAMATAAAVAASCATVGTLLVVRRMSLVGDAIAHALLPGIAVAVLAGGRPGQAAAASSNRQRVAPGGRVPQADRGF